MYMNMKFTKKQLIIFGVVAILLVCAMTTSSLYSVAILSEYIKASDKKVVSVDTTDSTTDATEPQAEDTTEPSTTEPASVVEVVNAQPGSVITTTKKSTTTKKADLTPSTKEEIADFYKKANKNAKAKAKSATKTYSNATNYNDVVEAGNLSFVASKIMGFFLKENTNLNEVHTDDVAKVIPPANATCNLKVSDIDKATCTDKGTYYLVTLLLKPDKNPKAGYGSGSICSVLTPEQISGPAAEWGVTVSDIVCDYDGAYCEAQIDKKTGNLLNLYLKLPMYLSMTAKGAFDLGGNAKVGLQFEDKWTIAY